MNKSYKKRKSKTEIKNLFSTQPEKKKGAKPTAYKGFKAVGELQNQTKTTTKKQTQKQTQKTEAKKRTEPPPRKIKMKSKNRL